MTVRVNLDLPDEHADAVDRVARGLSVSRNRVLCAAVQEFLVSRCLVSPPGERPASPENDDSVHPPNATSAAGSSSQGEVAATSSASPELIPVGVHIGSKGCRDSYVNTKCPCNPSACWVRYARDCHARGEAALDTRDWLAAGQPMPMREPASPWRKGRHAPRARRDASMRDRAGERK